MSAKKITKQDINFLKEHAQNQNWKVDDIKKVFDLINNPANATEIIKELSGPEISNLVDWVHPPIYDTWSTQQKIALVKKDISFFSSLPYLSSSKTMNNQELLKECLKEFNKKVSPMQRKDEYYFHFKSVFRGIIFNQENLETFIKSFPDKSPFIFEEYPFNEIKNWRELTKSNPHLALENRMLEAMDEVNFFSKGDLQKFTEKYDDLLKNKTFYNHFIGKANTEIKLKILNERTQAKNEMFLADSYGNHKEADRIEDESEERIGQIEDSLRYITATFGPYKTYIMEQELANQQKAGSGITA